MAKKRNLERISPGVYKDAEGRRVNAKGRPINRGQPKVRPSDPKSSPDPEDYANESVRELLGPDAPGARTIANELLPEGSAGRVETGFRVGPDGQPLRDAEGNPIRVGETAEDLARAKEFAATAGQRTGEMADVLSRHKAGLEGYTSQESQAFREAAQRGIDTQYKTGLSQLARAQARSGVRGASAAAQSANLNRSRVEEQQRLEQDLFVKNADEKQRRLGAYGTALSGQEGAEYNRTKEAGQMYSDTLAKQRADELARGRYNVEGAAAENAGRADLFFRGIDTGLQRDIADRNYRLARQALRQAR